MYAIEVVRPGYLFCFVIVLFAIYLRFCLPYLYLAFQYLFVIEIIPVRLTLRLPIMNVLL